MRLSINCPCCDTRSTAVKTKPISKVLTEVTYRCSNTECGFSFVAGLEILRAINVSPFALPQELGIPLSKHIDRRKLIQQLQQAPAARDIKLTDSASVPPQANLLPGFRSKLVQQVQRAPAAPEPQRAGSAPDSGREGLNPQAEMPTVPQQPNTWHGAVTSPAPARTSSAAALA